MTKRVPPTPEEQAAEKKAIHACQKGDMQAFEFLYGKYHSNLYRYLLAFLKSPHTAEDLTQDIFVKLFRQIGSYSFQSPFNHWLFRLAKNLAIDHLRREKVRFTQSLDADTADEHPLRERVASKSPHADAGALKAEQGEAVRQAVLSLPDDFREVVVLREWEDLAYEEISERLDLSVGTVKSRLFRARGLLLKKLKGWDGDE